MFIRILFDWLSQQKLVKKDTDGYSQQDQDQGPESL